MKRVLDRLGIAGLIIAIVIWGCAVTLGGPFVGRVFQGLFVALFASSDPPLAALSCPLALSDGEVKTITATIANAQRTEQTYLVTMEQPTMSSGPSIELCHQQVTVEPGGEKAVFCLVRLNDLIRDNSEQAWYLSVMALPGAHEYRSYSNPENAFSGSCIIRNQRRFWIDLAYGGGVILTALAIILWGAFLWPKGKWADRALIFLFSIVVYSLAWLLNATIWLGLSNLHLYFLILGGMLLVMFMILWSMG